MISATPAHIRGKLDNREDAAEKLAKRIQACIARPWEGVEDKTYEPRRTGITSNDLSQAVMLYLAVNRLRNLPGGLALAFELVLYLCKCSYGGLDEKCSGYGGSTV